MFTKSSAVGIVDEEDELWCTVNPKSSDPTGLVTDDATGTTFFARISATCEFLVLGLKGPEGCNVVNEDEV